MADGDDLGELSFYGGRGNALIDYCIGSQSFLKFISDFRIASKPYSDHMPLDFKISIPLNNNTFNSDLRQQKIYWSKTNAAKYAENLNQLYRTSTLQQESPVYALVSSIKNKILHVTVKTRHKCCFEPKQRWFN